MQKFKITDVLEDLSINDELLQQKIDQILKAKEEIQYSLEEGKSLQEKMVRYFPRTQQEDVNDENTERLINACLRR